MSTIATAPDGTLILTPDNIRAADSARKGANDFEEISRVQGRKSINAGERWTQTRYKHGKMYCAGLRTPKKKYKDTQRP